ncbi:MAG: iron ABC transporter permease, partial [Clostridia bacterium]|nr:iron ABC transporter permease [Clostridia bacterium]
MSSKKRTVLVFIFLFVLLLTFIFLNIMIGSVKLTPSEVMRILFMKSDNELNTTVIWVMRIPRILTALILGAALSVAGFLLQTFFHSPIAGPFVLGISSGAKLTVSISMIYLLSRGVVSSSVTLIISAFIGAMLSMGFVLVISQKVKRMSMLIICGVMIGYICNALTDFLVTFADD